MALSSVLTPLPSTAHSLTGQHPGSFILVVQPDSPPTHFVGCGQDQGSSLMVPADSALMGYGTWGQGNTKRFLNRQHNPAGTWHQAATGWGFSCPNASYGCASGTITAQLPLWYHNNWETSTDSCVRTGRQWGRKDIKRTSPWCWLHRDSLKELECGAPQPGVFAGEARATTEAKCHCWVACKGRDGAAIAAAYPIRWLLPPQAPGEAPAQAGLHAPATTLAAQDQTPVGRPHADAGLKSQQSPRGCVT